MKIDWVNVAIGFDDHIIVISSRTTTIPNFLTNTKVSLQRMEDKKLHPIQI